MRDDNRPVPEDRPDTSEPSRADRDEDTHESLPDEAVYSPDDPIARPEGEIPDDAIYSPDDPISTEERGEGVATGMAGRQDWERGQTDDLFWQVRYTADILETFAQELRDHGMEALRMHPNADPVEILLRSFVAGYLVGRTDLEE